MKSYSLGLYEKSMPDSLSWEERLRLARKSGFDFVEVSIDETDRRLSRLWEPECGEEILRATEQTGVPVGSVCLSGHRKYPFGSHDPAVREKSMEIMERALLFAGRIGARIIQLAGYDVYYESHDAQTQAFFVENLRRAVDSAAKSGICLAFETMETPFMDTVEKAMAYVSKIASPYLQIYCDIGNLTNASILYGTSVADDLETGRGHLAAVHLKETAPGRYREVPFGAGQVDFGGCIRKAASLGVRRFVGEFWYTGGENWEQDLSSAGKFLHERLRTAFEEIGKGGFK